MCDVCKLNTTTYHPLSVMDLHNRTLKTALRKLAAQFGVQWNNCYWVLYGPIEIPHASQLMRDHLTFFLEGLY